MPLLLLGVKCSHSRLLFEMDIFLPQKYKFAEFMSQESQDKIREEHFRFRINSNVSYLAWMSEYRSQEPLDKYPLPALSSSNFRKLNSRINIIYKILQCKISHPKLMDKHPSKFERERWCHGLISFTGVPSLGTPHLQHIFQIFWKKYFLFYYYKMS